MTDVKAVSSENNLTINYVGNASKVCYSAYGIVKCVPPTDNSVKSFESLTALKPWGALPSEFALSVRLSLQPSSTFARTMACGAGDLVVPAGSTRNLKGGKVYGHACIYGRLELSANATLIAQSIQVGSAGDISVDAAGQNRDYSSTLDPCDAGAAHASAVVGVSGQDGASGTSTGALDGATGGTGGTGGGAVVLIAHRILIAGTVTADGGNGGAGEDGWIGSPTAGDSTPGAGGDGGSGGDISIVGDEVQISGTLDASGGDGGSAGANAGTDTTIVPNGIAGNHGCIRLVAGFLYSGSGYFVRADAGTLTLGRLLPTDPAPPTLQAPLRYFTSTKHSVAGTFLAFWQTHGGTAVFGEPLTGPFDASGQTVQYFERSGLVLSTAGVRISPLGTLLTTARHFAPVAPFASTTSRRYFTSTKHALSGRFLTYWLQHRGSDLFGSPISEPFTEQNGDGTGRGYLVQYFQNARLEYHPEYAQTAYAVSLGLLGREYLQSRGLL